MNIDAQWRADITRQMGDMAKAQQDTALVLERIAARITSVERWQTEAEEERKWREQRREQRRDTRDDERPEQTRATIALLVSSAGIALYALSILATHWRP